jgi:hypothetical protein
MFHGHLTSRRLAKVVCSRGSGGMSFLAVFLISCGTSQSVARPITQATLDQIKSEGLEQTTKVVFTADKGAAGSTEGDLHKTGGEQQLVSFEGVLVGAGWKALELRLDQDRHTRIPFADVQRIQIKDRKKGALEGLLIGMVGGIVAGAIVGAVSSTGCEDGEYYYQKHCPSASEKAFSFGLIGALVGGGAGLGIGIASGHRTVFVF